MNTEYMSIVEKIDYIKERIPEDVYKVFTKEWDNFIYSCSENTSWMIEDETGDGEEFDEYLNVFMEFPH